MGSSLGRARRAFRATEKYISNMSREQRIAFVSADVAKRGWEACIADMRRRGTSEEGIERLARVVFGDSAGPSAERKQ